jgi:predicted RNA-binding protein with PIN domain
MMYLIDGYNLLFAYLGTPPSRKLSKALERGRRRLLDLLRLRHEGDLANITVVFDAAHAPSGTPAESDHHGIHVVFAIQHERADDLIEQMIRRASTPRQICVVTDDHHIQQAARRRHCIVQGCADYLNALDRPGSKSATKVQPVATKPHALTVEETQHWLDEFADLARDPSVKELADPFGFGTDDKTRSN